MGERYSPPLPRAAGEIMRKTGFLQTKAYQLKTEVNFSDFFIFLKERHSCTSYKKINVVSLF
jgi:hypothetical protein